ncbi:MAG: hypothetical protein NZ927_03975 [Candidatus Calescibacterium sp.]|nr:hypothetical protein [Candidatus Calescibacterium sp.]MCX7734286.1 hypothetical protein [bacterium]MDW8087117.1 hypothetical protein [Candidatus Calescibacterium sp.]
MRTGIKKLKLLFLCSFFVSTMLSFPNLVYAQQKKAPQKKVIKLKEIVIKQRVIKPQAMFILSKSQQANVKSDITTSQTFSQETLKTINEDFLR